MKQKKMTKKEWERRWNTTTKELLAMYRKSFPILLKSYHDVEYNKAIKDFNKKAKLLDK